MSKKRVLHIITVFSIGGATASMLNMALEMKRRGYDVRIFTGMNVRAEGDLFKEAADFGIQIEVIPHLVKEIAPIQDLLAFVTLWRKIAFGNFDAVHTHTAKAGILGRFAAKLAGVKNIFHTLYLLSFHQHQARLLRQVFIALEKVAYGFTDAIFSVSQTMIDVHLKNGIGKKERYHAIQNSIQDNLFQNLLPEREELRKKYASKFHFDEQDVLVSKIARITKLKGQHFFVDIAERVHQKNPRVKFLMVGGGENAEAIRELIAEKKLEKVVLMTGTVQPAVVPEIIKMSDILAMTSLHEGLPVVFQEAMALKKPIVSFDLDGAQEVIEEGKNGFLIEATPVNEESLNRFSERVLQLAADEKLRKEMGEQSFEKAYLNFTTEVMMRQILQVYEQAFNLTESK